ncbi:MAG: T9SS type A sorting domain-containing protein [Ignavibacteriales bacterium]|nr:T9SS type A sorting domain-containing protein [Ignavibacteriales bacterium]
MAIAKYSLGLPAEFLGHKTWSLGTVDTFWVYNFTQPTPDRVPAELRGIGTYSLVWVSVAELENGHVDSAVVQTLLDALEVRTPPSSRDSTRGVVNLTRDHFGDPPNVDVNFTKTAGDGRTHFLLCDIQDGWTPSGGSYIAGFFYEIDVGPSSLSQYSNRRDLLYIDTYPGIFLNNVRDATRPLGTLSHEFQHLIHWNYDPDEITFFNEGLSEFSSYVCGYGLRSPALYLDNTNRPFLGWGSDLRDYSRAALWTLYLSEQIGDAFIRAFTQHPEAGRSGFEAAVAQLGSSMLLPDAVESFHIANIVQDRSLNSAYGYLDTTVLSSGPNVLQSSFSSGATGTRPGLFPFAADYVRLFAPETLDVTVTATSGSVSSTLIETRDQTKNVVLLPSGSPHVSTFSGSAYSEAILVLFNPGSGTTAAYTYASAGVSKEGMSVEIRHDDGVSHSLPNTLFLSSDTAYVAFDAVEGGRIDSIAFWFASTGFAQVFVRDWNSAYDLDFQPLGGLAGRARMQEPAVSLSVTDTGFMRTVVSLAGRDVRSAPGFVVQMIYGPGAPNPLLRRDADQARLRSYLYLRDEPTAGRRMYSSFGDFYVRVFLSATNEPPSPPPGALPAAFALYQNFPNPFNPSTTIRFDVPVRTRVRLAVYDILGREVAVLRDEVLEANSYDVVLDGGKLASGVYFVRMTAPQVVQTRKVVLVR